MNRTSILASESPHLGTLARLEAALGFPRSPAPAPSSASGGTHVAARHAGLIPAVGLEVYGKFLLGISEQVSLMV
ncbi:hypothetical protein ACFWOY_31125 [Streptomyces sp. NPDC058423]|uniref:hypothetical protein n=1 Tax=unclassified Streptomyces TaxID=2593676 RepID=UPI00365137F1